METMTRFTPSNSPQEDELDQLALRAQKIVINGQPFYRKGDRVFANYQHTPGDRILPDSYLYIALDEDGWKVFTAGAYAQDHAIGHYSLLDLVVNNQSPERGFLAPDHETVKTAEPYHIEIHP